MQTAVDHRLQLENCKLSQLVELEFKHRCKQVLELGFPMHEVSKLFAPDWEGDITIVMPGMLAQGPSSKTRLCVIQMLEVMERAAWIALISLGQTLAAHMWNQKGLNNKYFVFMGFNTYTRKMGADEMSFGVRPLHGKALASDGAELCIYLSIWSSTILCPSVMDSAAMHVILTLQEKRWEYSK
ncbi:hypothetical protein GOP47_0005470 [Adiantum capillus-veneris]|uniref:Uncharacterized protein n=1 Tax=Adiantum capillus-veneris TaxID=13818 RepID=A0A9D4ZNL0_ADICA|nr:hypothetical protein GOP47_0005470 [Adiantum capillus-veneris]